VPAIFLAWLAGEGIIIYRTYKTQHHPPMPGQLLASSALFAALGLLADSAPQARFLAAAMAWGFDVAAFLNVAPQILTGSAAAKVASAENPAGKSTKLNVEAV
jgi:hypothetical protein